MAVGLNHYSELIRYIKSLLEQDDLVNTITFGSPEEMDLNKMNIYPLANIEINDASFTNGQNVVFDVVISTMNQRDTTNEVNGSKIWYQNEVDNYNEMLAILNRLWSKMLYGFNDNNITASENPQALKRKNVQDKNNLEGWQLSFQVTMPNTALNLCQ
ncbi:hypothetical protein [Polaribacter sp.]|uniref:hypothetical protein n=1 Tax=Polaribacter sp. TaxID=1920175 RepID=UPI003F6C42B5